MRARHARSRRSFALIALTALPAIGATTAMTATAAAPSVPIVCAKAPCEATPAPPINDNYLNALNLNEPSTPHHRGTPLNRTETLRDERNTAAATVQSDILGSQPGPGRADGLQRRRRGQDDLVRLLPERQRAGADPHLGLASAR